MITKFKKHRLAYLLIFILVMIILFIICKTPKEEENVEERFISAMEIRKKDFYQAEDLLKQIIIQNPKSEYASKSFDVIAEVYSKSRFDKKLIKLYEDIKYKPVQISSDSLFMVGISYYWCDEYKQAAKIVLKINENEFDQATLESYYYLAICSFYNIDQNELAEKYLNMLLDHNPNEYEIFESIGAIFLNKNNINEALNYYQKYFSKCIEQKEEYTKSELYMFLFIQELYIQQKMYEQAYINLSNLYTVILESSMFYEEYVCKLGVSAYYIGEFEIAREKFEYLMNNSKDERIIKLCEYINSTFTLD